MSKHRDITARIVAPLVVYGAIIVGMYWLRSGWGAILLYHLGACLVLTAAGAWGAVLSKLRRGWHRSYGLFAMAACATAGPLIYLAWPEIHLADLTMKTALAGLGLEGWAMVAFIVYYSTVNPVIEELFWRGWYGTDCKWPVAVDILFGGYHIFVVVTFVKTFQVGVVFVLLSCAGFFWRYFTKRLDGLLVPVLSHATADLSIVIAACWLN
jgi:membrane protease YdiL (CAAX protease family)